jgi:hypothetical protein
MWNNGEAIVTPKSHQIKLKRMSKLSHTVLIIIQGAAERSPLFGKVINSKPKKIWQMFFYLWKVHRMPFYINMF